MPGCVCVFIPWPLTQELHNVLVPAVEQLGHAHQLVLADLRKRSLDPLSTMAVAHVPYEVRQALVGQEG